MFHNKPKFPKFKGHHDVKECDHKVDGKYIHEKIRSVHEGQEMVTISGSIGDRKLPVPNRNPCEMPGIIPTSEFERLKRQALVITREDRKKLIEEAELKKIRLQQESQARKELLEKAQLSQTCQPSSRLGIVEEEAAQKNAHTLQRAIELRQEQEENIRKVNSIVLATKCMAIRDAQLQEKKIIKEEMHQEEQRIEAMMEQRRQITVLKELGKIEREKEKRLRFVEGVRQQMKENEIARLLEAERAEEETRMNARAVLEMQKEEAEKERRKQLDVKKTQQEMREANLNTQRCKQMRQEEERIADLRVQNFMKMKAEREEAYLAELETIKLVKEREIARLRIIQQQFRDQKNEMEELRYKREVERVNKEWREKEKQAAQKRKVQIEDLKRERAMQIEDLRKTQVVEIAREEAELKKVGRVQRELFEQDHQKVVKRKEAADRLRKDLLLQIGDKEKEKIVLQKKKFREGEAQRLEVELRELKIRENMQKKVEALKELNVPERYIRDVYRQIDLIKK